MKLKLGALVFIVFVKLNLFGQNIDLSSYAWDSKPMHYQLTAEEQKQSSIILSSKKFIEFKVSKEEGLQKYLVTHTIQVLNDDRAVEGSNKIYIPINYSSKLENIFSRVVYNGKVVSEQGIKDVKKLEEKEVQYYLLALEGVGKGAMVETIIFLKLSESLSSSDYIQSHTPAKFVQYTLLSPGNLSFKTKIYNSNIAPTDTVQETQRVITYTLRNVPAMEEEKYAHPNANRIRIEYTFDKNLENPAVKSSTWADMGKIYHDRLFSNYSKNSKEIDKLLKKLQLKDKTFEEKAFLIENFVKTNINLVLDAPDVDLVADIVKNKYSNQLGVTQLIVLGLERAKIPFEIVISCSKEEKKFDPDFESWSFLNEVVIYLPESNLFITPANQFLRTGYLPASLLGQKGLFIKSVSDGKARKSESAIKTIPVNEMENSIDKHLINVVFNEDMSQTNIEVRKEMSNYACLGVKPVYYYSDETQRKNLLESFLTNGMKDIVVKKANIENFDITSLKEYKLPLVLTATLTTDIFLENAGGKILLKIGELIGPQEQIYQEKKRQNPVDMPYAHAYEREIKVKIPEGYKMEGLEKLKINHKFSNAEGPMFGFESRFEIKNSELIVYCREFYKYTSFSVKQFDDFRKVINDAADFNKITILLKKVK